MARFLIRGGRPLEGEVRVSGNKNAALPMLAATLLTDEEVVLENVPDIRDVRAMLEILDHLGAEVSFEAGTARVRAAEVRREDVPRALCERVRTSILFAGPLLHRRGRARLAAGGGEPGRARGASRAATSSGTRTCGRRPGVSSARRPGSR